jgi:hypothetical protein
MTACTGKLSREDLLAIVQELIADSPFEFEGFAWAARSQTWYCEKLGVSKSTLGRWISTPPFVRDQVVVEGRKVSLLRIGIPGPMTIRHKANVMSKLWRKELERYHSIARKELAALKVQIGSEDDVATDAPQRIKKLEQFLARPISTTHREYGCLCGLAEHWPDGAEVALFKLVLKDWPAFMSGVKVQLAEMAGKGQPVKWRYYEWPSLAVVRRFANIAIEMAIMDAQMLGQTPHPSVKATQPHIWPASL